MYTTKPLKHCIFTTIIKDYTLLPFGGPDGELGASLRYFSQKFDMITPQAIAVLNDIGTEEPAHNSYHYFISYSLNNTLYLYVFFQAQLLPQ